MQVWWVNQRDSFLFETWHSVVQASDQAQRLTDRSTVGEILRGDCIVHYAGAAVMGFSRAAAAATYVESLGSLEIEDDDGTRASLYYGSGWRAPIEDFRFCGIERADFAPKLMKHVREHKGTLPRPYAWRKYGKTIGRAAQGYCFRFDLAGLRILAAAATDPLPEWLPPLID
jgi:hypothetical protein